MFGIGSATSISEPAQEPQKILPKCKGANPTVGEALEQVARLTAGTYPLSQDKAEEMLDGFHQHGFASYF